MKDERFMTALGLNPFIDDINQQFLYPQKFKPVLSALNNKQIIVRKEFVVKPKHNAVNKRNSSNEVIIAQPA